MRVPFERQQYECVMAKTELSSALLYMCSVPADIVWHQKCTCLPSYVTSCFIVGGTRARLMRTISSLHGKDKPVHGM